MNSGKLVKIKKLVKSENWCFLGIYTDMVIFVYIYNNI